MVHYIKLGGKERPLSFGYEVGYSYESATGGNYNELIYKIASEITKAGEAMNENDLGRVAAAMSIKPMTDVVYFGLKHAHRHEGVEIDFDVETVAGWLFGSQAAMQACVTALFESLPKPGEGDADAKKKTVARPGSTGKGLSKRLR